MKSRTIYLWQHDKVVEPEKRNKDGLRWIIHRFPIKNGISIREAMLIDARQASIDFVQHLQRRFAEIEKRQGDAVF